MVKALDLPLEPNNISLKKENEKNSGKGGVLTRS